MKVIKSVTHKGIKYVDEFGVEKFIDFKKCNDAWIKYKNRTNGLNKTSITDKYVGQRDICAEPCFIEFFTYPKFTKFEFEKTDKCSNPKELFTRLKENIIAAGWHTIDLS